MNRYLVNAAVTRCGVPLSQGEIQGDAEYSPKIGLWWKQLQEGGLDMVL